MIKKIKEWVKNNHSKNKRQKVADAIKNSIRRFSWSYTPPVEYKDVCTQIDWNQTLMAKINEANAHFYGNTIIASAEINAILEDLVYYKPVDKSENKFNSDFHHMATLSNRFNIYVDHYLPAHYLLIVHEDFFTAENPECVLITVENIPRFN